MDWSMPAVDGVAATRELRAERPGVAVIAFSSTADAGVRAAFVAADAARHIDTPDVDGLPAAVVALEARPAGRRASGPAEPDERFDHVRPQLASAGSHVHRPRRRRYGRARQGQWGRSCAGAAPRSSPGSEVSEAQDRADQP
jgi:chemotaxis response regulator CheB